MKKLYIASDHAAFELKQQLIQLETLGVEWEDLGPDSNDSVHYPNYAQDVCRRIVKERSSEELLKPCGVLLCGSGVGMSMAANRFKGIRAVLARDSEVARLSREHNASNVLCMGARLMSETQAIDVLKSWLETPFEGGRHKTRVEMMDQ